MTPEERLAEDLMAVLAKRQHADLLHADCVSKVIHNNEFAVLRQRNADASMGLAMAQEQIEELMRDVGAYEDWQGPSCECSRPLTLADVAAGHCPVCSTVLVVKVQPWSVRVGQDARQAG